MKKIFGFFIVLIFQFTFLSFDMVYSNPMLFEVSSEGVVHVSDEIIVQFKSGTANQQIQVLNEELGSAVMDVSQKGKFIKIKVPSDKTAEEFAEIYNKLPDVQTAELNPIGAAFFIPNDGYYKYQWNYPRINMEKAWDIEMGDPAVIVAIVDTGIAFEDYGIYGKAPDFADTSFVSGYDFVNNDSHPNDDNGHGTHVAGTVAQTTNNSLGVAGMCSNCTLMPIKVLDSNGFGSAYNIAKGITWAADHGAKIINLSLGFDPGVNPGSVLKNAIQDAYNRGVLIVAATGNAGVAQVSYPAAYNEVIAVGSVTSDNIIAGYSQYGSAMELVAPGGDSGDRNGDGYMDGILQQSFGATPTDFGYYFMTGTSMATPHVSGLAALILSQDLNRTNIEIRQILRDTATEMGPQGWDTVYGYGRIEGKNALSQINLPPTATISGPASATVGDSVSFNGSSSKDPEGNNLTFFWYFGDGNSSTEINPSHIYGQSGSYSVTLKVNDGSLDSVVATHSITVANVNQKPVANAGINQTVTDTAGDGVESVTMDGSASQDPDGDTLTYNWSWSGGSSTGVSPSISVPIGTTVVTLSVSDGNLTDSDTVQIIVASGSLDPPAANAGADITVNDTNGDGVETVSLNGSGSGSLNGSSLLYFWVWSGGSASGVTPTITLSVGTTQVSLIVYDGLLTSTDTVQVTVIGVSNDPPGANAGPDQTITDNDGNGFESVTLDGSGSFDPNGDSLTYAWNWTGGTAGGVRPNVNMPVGTTNITMTVFDGQKSDSDSVRITIIANEGNNRPIADPGSDVTLSDIDNDGFESVSLDASNSSDPDGDNLSYYWVWKGGNTNGVNPTITLPVGTTSVTLTVFDGELINYDAVQITIAPGQVNNPPLADAGASKSLIDSDNDNVEMVILDGSGSYDPDGDSLTYSWTWPGGSASGISPTVVLPVGNTIITLSVSDGELSDSASIQISIAAGDPNNPPLANAGSDRTVTDNDGSGFESIALDGSGSYDPDGDSITYNWTWTGGSASGVSPIISFPVGTTSINLKVSDAEFIAQDSVLVEVLARPNNAPQANAGSDRTVTDNDGNGFESIALDGSNSSDPDGDSITYNWTWAGGSASGVSPIISFPVGITTITLTVSDGKLSNSDSMQVTVLQKPSNLTLTTTDSSQYIKSSFSVSERIYLNVQYINLRGRAVDEATISATIYDQNRNAVATLRGKTNERGKSRIGFTMNSNAMPGKYEIQVTVKGDRETTTGIIYFELTGL